MNYDSKEELYFSWYLDELVEAGYVARYEPQPESFLLADTVIYEYEKHLKTKTKTLFKTLLREHIYSPDFRVVWHKKVKGVFYDSIYGQVNLLSVPFFTVNSNISYIEIKPAFSLHNSQREFSINQKWMFQKHGFYVQKIIIANKGNNLFAKTFTPAKYLYTEKTKKLKKLKYQPRMLSEFLSKNKA